MSKIYLFLLSSCFIFETRAQKTALLIIDVQNCFTPGGSMPVSGGDAVIPVINDLRTRLMRSFDLFVISQDWHCVNHVSFASIYPGYAPLNSIDLTYNSAGDLCRSENITHSYTVNCTGQTNVLQQTLWPDHCIMDTQDASLHVDLVTEESDVYIQKGFRCHLDSYSVFYDNGHYEETDLRQILSDNDVTRLYLTGLATDYCVYWSAKDAIQLGFETYVVIDATRGIDSKTTEAAIEDMIQLGVRVINSTEVESTLPIKSKSSPLDITTITVLLASFVCVQLTQLV